MAKATFVKKISNILLAIMLCVSLLLFSACGDFSDDDTDSSGRSIRPTVKLIYRPYSSNEITSGVTYIDAVYNGILDLSENILTEIVGQYGMGEIRLLGEGGDLVYTRSPNTNGRNYKEMFCVNETSVLSPAELILSDAQKTELINKRIGEDMGRMTHVNYTHEFLNLEAKALILSYGDSPSVAEILTKILFPVVGDSPLAIMGSIENTSIYKIDTGSTTYYVFLGGKGLGMNGENLSYVPTTTGENSYDFTQTKTYLKHILGCNYGVIEKDYIATENIIDGETVALNFQHWNYSIADGDIENKLPALGDGIVVSTGNPYLEAYLEKFGLTFAVDIAKAMLVGGEELPTDVVCPKDLLDGDKKIVHTSGVVNLKNLYDKAKSGNDTDKQNFIWTASAFVDHLGFSKSDVEFIKNQIKTTVIGENVYNKSENASIFKNNYDLFLFSLDGTESALNGVTTGLSAFRNALDQNPPKPILEWINLSNTVSYSEDASLEIPGYLQSIVLMSEGDLIVDAFHMEVEFDDSSIIDYVVTPRYRHESVSEDALFGASIAEVNEQILKGTVEVDFSKIEFGSVGHLEEVKVSDKIDVLNLLPIHLQKKTSLEDDFYKCFNTDKEAFPYDEDIYYHAWYFDFPTNYLELVFATKNMFSLTNLNIANFSFWAG